MTAFLSGTSNFLGPSYFETLNGATTPSHFHTVLLQKVQLLNLLTNRIANLETKLRLKKKRSGKNEFVILAILVRTKHTFSYMMATNCTRYFPSRFCRDRVRSESRRVLIWHTFLFAPHFWTLRNFLKR